MAGPLIFGAGILLLGYLFLDEVLYRVPPQFRRRAGSLLPTGRFTLRSLLPLPICLALAFLMREARLVALYLVGLSLLSTWYFTFQRPAAEERAEMNTEVRRLVEEFRSTYTITPSVFSALERARGKAADPLREHVSAAVETFYITASPQRALAELRGRLQNPYLNQFVYILERSEQARHQAVLEALDGLLERLRRHEQLREETETNLTVITGQTQVVLALGVIFLYIVALIPGLRQAYVGSLGSQLLYVVLVSVGAGTAYYMDRQVVSLKQRVL